ncbi:NAD-dependent epimerase/dehydratase family protein [Micrococcaceae bacterium Sec5.7]
MVSPASETVAPRNILFIGGTGVISAAAAEHAVALGHRLTILNRGKSPDRPAPEGAEVLHADVRDAGAVREVLRGREFDAVADFISFTREHAAAGIEQFRGRTGQYVFISSASAYQKPPARLPILESTPLRNPFWQYSRDKIACEDLLFRAYRDENFPVTVVRPSHTYDRSRIALLGGWTDIHRMRCGLPVLVHGDGTSLWTLTHSRDFAKAFVGLLGRPQAVGESYTITSDEYLPWDQVYRLFARAAGVPGPELVHVASETIAAHDPSRGPGLLGDRAHSVVFDNTKIKSLVPGFNASIPFSDGAREIVQWHDAHPGLQVVDQGFMDLSDQLIGWARRAV